MIMPMCTSLIGQHIPRDERTNAISYLMTGNALLYLIGMPLCNYIGDWRQSFIYFSIPVLLLSLILVTFFIPRHESIRHSSDVLEGYKGVFSSKSAVASLLGHALGHSVWAITASLAFSFFREEFSMSRASVVYLMLGSAFSYMVGAILSRRIVPFFGRKKSVMVAIIAMGLFSLIYLVGGSFIVALVSSLLVCFFAGVYQSASQGLNLEQLPDLRGPMMSMVSAFQNIGNVISISISGFLLVLYGWNALGGLVVLFSIIGSLILNFFAVEPN
jgi:predicted MFS family arabinose efflux permease